MPVITENRIKFNFNIEKSDDLSSDIVVSMRLIHVYYVLCGGLKRSPCTSPVCCIFVSWSFGIADIIQIQMREIVFP